MSALRALESTLILLEEFEIPIHYIDSKEWQKVLLPKGISKEALKIASLDIGNRYFPLFKSHRHPDRDALLIAEWGRRNNI